jgi:ABC-type antimicrobial peptide transport system permease subunit
MKLQHLIASVIAFIVVLLVGIYVLHLIVAELFPSENTWITYGIPELLGLILALVAAWYAGKMSAKLQTPEK